MSEEKKKKPAHKKAKKVALTTATAASLLVNNTYDSVDEIIKHEEDSIDPVIRKYEETHRQATPKEKLRGWFDHFPYAVRLLVLVPLWAIGWALMLVLGPLWNGILSPLASKVGYWLAILAIVMVILAAAKMILLPEVPFKKLFTKKNVIIIVVSVAAIAGLDELLSRMNPGYVKVAYLLRFTAILLFISIFMAFFYRNYQKKIVTATTDQLEFTASN